MRDLDVLTEAAEKAFAGWLLRDFAVAAIAEVAEYLRPQDFANPVHALVYEMALTLAAERRDAGIDGATPADPDDLYFALLERHPARTLVTLAQLSKVRNTCPHVVAPKDWAARIVENAARRAVHESTYRLTEAVYSPTPAAALERLRTNLRGRIYQMLDARSLLDGSTFTIENQDAGFDWRQNVDLVMPSRRPHEAVFPGEGAVIEDERFVLAAYLRHPDVAAALITAGDTWLQPSELCGPGHAAILQAMFQLVARDQPVNAPSVLCELPQLRPRRSGVPDLETMQLTLEDLESYQVPDRSAVEPMVAAATARLVIDMAVRYLRTESQNPANQVVRVVESGRDRTARASLLAAAAEAIPARPRFPLAPLPPAPAQRRPPSGPSARETR